MISDTRSFWHKTAPLLPLSADIPHSVDVVVIGGGLMGTATCYWLALLGLSVALLEREAIGCGATGRNGGFVVSGSAGGYMNAIADVGHTTALSTMRITLENQQLLRQVLQEEEILCDYREPGQLRLALSAEEEEQLRHEVAAFQRDGFQASFLDRDTVQRFIKTPLAPMIRGGRLKPEQGLIHSARFVRGLAQAARRRGAQISQGNVQKILPDGDGFCVHMTSGKLSAQAVVVATNVWIRQLFPELAKVIQPVREQMLAYAPIAPVFSHGLSARCVAGEYFQQTPDGTILIGGCNTVAPNEDRDVWQMTTLPVVQQAIEGVLPHLFPALASSLHVIERWAGLLDCTTDRHPIVDRFPSLPNAFFLCGFSGHGMSFGLRLGQLLAEAVTSGTMSALLGVYALERESLQSWDC